MARHRLKHGCCFVDAQDHDTSVKKPDSYPFPHVFRKEARTYVAFNDVAAFIARFIVLGVDTNIIAQILVSEYGAVDDPRGAVDTVYRMMKGYLEDRPAGTDYTDPGNYQSPAQLPHEHDGSFKLDFSTNPVGIINLKTPIS